jgi:hypothetical protein
MDIRRKTKNYLRRVGLSRDLSSIFRFWGSMRLSPLGTSITIWPIVQAPDDGQWWVWSSRWNEWQEKQKYSQEAWPRTTLSATNPACPCGNLPHERQWTTRRFSNTLTISPAGWRILPPSGIISTSGIAAHTHTIVPPSQGVALLESKSKPCYDWWSVSQYVVITSGSPIMWGRYRTTIPLPTPWSGLEPGPTRWDAGN